MDKVKSFVSKFFRPSFLHSNDKEEDRLKRKRSLSTDENRQNQPIDTTNHSSSNVDFEPPTRLKYHRSVLVKNPPPPTNSTDVNIDSEDEHEQQNKRRRTTSYQERQPASKPASPAGSPSVSSETCNTPKSQNGYQPRQTFNESSFFNNDRNSSVFSSASRFFPSNVQSDGHLIKSQIEEVPCYLLANSLADRTKKQQPNVSSSLPTLTNPTGRNLFQMNSSYFQPSYPFNETRRMHYIERLRIRTMENSTTANAESNEQTGSKTDDSVSFQNERQEKSAKTAKAIRNSFVDAAVQYEYESNTENAPETDIEILTQDSTNVSPKENSSIQTESSIIITTRPIDQSSDNSMPKMLCNATPFSWPKFIRAHDQFLTENPLKCSNSNVLFSSKDSLSATQDSSNFAKLLFDSTSNPTQQISTLASVSTINSSGWTSKQPSLAFVQGSPFTGNTSTDSSSTIKFGTLSSFPETNFNSNQFSNINEASTSFRSSLQTTGFSFNSSVNSSKEDGLSSNVTTTNSSDHIPFGSPNATPLFSFGQPPKSNDNRVAPFRFPVIGDTFQFRPPSSFGSSINSSGPLFETHLFQNRSTKSD